MSRIRLCLCGLLALCAPAHTLFAQGGAPAPQQPLYAPAAQSSTTAVTSYEGAACKGSLWDHLRPWFQWTHWGYPEEFKTVPFGVRTQAHLRTQVCNGLAVQLVLFRYDFGEESSPQAGQLTAVGQKRLAYVVALVEKYQAHPIAVEASGNPALDQVRRQAVLAAIASQQVTIPAEWVVIAEPASINIRGADAMLIYANLLRQTKAGGITAGVSAASGTQQQAVPTGQSPTGQGGGSGQ